MNIQLDSKSRQQKIAMLFILAAVVGTLLNALSGNFTAMFWSVSAAIYAYLFMKGEGNGEW